MKRAWWLARPWFLAAVAVLAVNDHLLKTAVGGWLTGKLSDFAGLVVIATMIAVLGGRSVGVGVAAVGFTALKVVPGVAELAAPVLGGVTLRDPWDLIALLALPGVWVLLGRDQGRSAKPYRSLQAIGLIGGLLATTATSQSVPQTTDYLASVGWARDGAFYLRVDKAVDSDLHYLRSVDGGRTWQDAPSDRVRTSAATQVDLRSASPSPTSHSIDRIKQACADDGVCYRTRVRDTNSLPEVTEFETLVQRRDRGGDWVTEATYADDATDRFDEFALNLADSEQVVGLLDDGRVAYRDGHARYRPVKVLG